MDALWDASGQHEAKRTARLERTLGELAAVVADAKLITAGGEAAFRRDRRLQLASEAVISHLGEVVSRLPSSYIDQHPEVAWREVAGMRNRVIHEYQHVSLDLMWSALSADVPSLAAALERPRSKRSKPFRQRAHALGINVDVSNVAEALDIIERPRRR